MFLKTTVTALLLAMTASAMSVSSVSKANKKDDTCKTIPTLPNLAGWYKLPEPISANEGSSHYSSDTSMHVYAEYQPDTKTNAKLDVNLDLAFRTSDITNKIDAGANSFMSETIVEIKFKSESGQTTGVHLVHFDFKPANWEYCTFKPDGDDNAFDVMVYVKKP